MVALRVGQFDRRVTVEEAVVVTEEDGQQSRIWTTYCERWAELMRATAVESVKEGVQTAPQRSVTFRVRHDTTTAAITERMRVRFGERIYGIESVQDEEGERQVIVIAATERVGV